MENHDDLLPPSEKIYKDYHDRLYRYIRLRISNEQTAQDLLSEVLLKLYEKYESYDSHKASLSTWVYAVARNTLYDYFRKEARRDVIVPLSDLENEPADSDFTTDLIREESLEKLALTLEQLPETERDLIILLYYHELSLKESAKRLGIGYSAAKYHHQMALSRLHRHLDEK